jgi:hypothetical protein
VHQGISFAFSSVSAPTEYNPVIHFYHYLRGMMTNWYPSELTLKSIDDSTKLLIDNFPIYIDQFERAFDEDKTFAGPSLYFHFKCISEYKNIPLKQKLNDNRFFELIYATLASWGMHRMGKTMTKLRNFNNFKNEILEQRSLLFELEDFKIWEIDYQQLNQKIIEEILDSMKVTKAYANLVANSKVLHHILPNLIPPIDRRYTLAYFGINTMLPSQKPASEIFTYLYPKFVEISKELENHIKAKVDLNSDNWNTSFTKIIDNGIIGSQL